MTTAYLSSLGMVTAAVVYLLAMLAHAVEWASLRGVDPAGAVPARVGSKRRQLVAAGAGGSGSSAVVDADVEDVDDEVEDEDAWEDGDDEAPLTDEEVREEALYKTDKWSRIGIALTLIAFACHALGVVTRGIAAGRLPWGNMYEFVTSSLLVVVAAYLVCALRFKMRWLGLPATLLASIGLGVAVTLLYVAVGPLVPALHSVWFAIHIVAAVVSCAAFNLGALTAIAYLLRYSAERRHRVEGYLAKLPSAKRLDELSYRFHAFAFPVWTFTIIAGSIWAEYAWGRFWGWDPKETWSLVTWVIYAGYLHARLTAGWKGKRAATIALIGVASFWFNFVGINLLVSGLHSYAGV